jgi:hypothetical protein
MTAAGREPKIFRAGKLLSARHLAARLRNLQINTLKSEPSIGDATNRHLTRHYPGTLDA